MPKTRTRTSIGPALAQLLERSGLSQTAAAERLGKPAQSVSRLLKEDYNPQIETVRDFLDVVGATLADLEYELRRIEGREAPPIPRAWAEEAAIGGDDRDLVERLRRHAAEQIELANALEQRALAEKTSSLNTRN